MKPAPPLHELLDRARTLEDGPELDRALDTLAEHVCRRFRLRDRHLLALEDFASWGDSSPIPPLRRLGKRAAWEALAPGISPERWMRSACGIMEHLLAPPGHSRTIADDPGRRMALEDVQLAGSAYDAEDQLVADELADHYRGHNLTEAERAVLEARISLGPGASGAEVAALAGVSPGSERVLTFEIRAKLVNKSAGEMPYRVRG